MNCLLLLLFGQGLEPMETVKVGAPMVAYTLPDQHGKVHSFTPGTRWVLISFEKRTGSMVKRWLKKKEHDYLPDMDWIVEISSMPESIARKIALPKMRKLKRPVLIASQTSLRKVFLMRDKMLTVLQLDPQGIVEAIHYVADSKTLKALVAGS